MHDELKPPPTADNLDKALETIKTQINEILPALRNYNNSQHLVELFESVVTMIDNHLISERKKDDEVLERFKDPKNRRFNFRDE